jgi:hypothetical protein
LGLVSLKKKVGKKPGHVKCQGSLLHAGVIDKIRHD